MRDEEIKILREDLALLRDLTGEGFESTYSKIQKNRLNIACVALNVTMLGVCVIMLQKRINKLEASMKNAEKKGD